jgi:GNAT superfamily N-acetyltransferase
MAGDVEVVRGGPELVDDVRALWLALRDHHVEVMPGMGPKRDDEDSWAHRRALYGRWLANPRAFVLLARDGGGAGDVVGYALVRPEGASSTWQAPKDPALLESLSIGPAARGGGLGAALMARVREECRREGFDALLVGAMAHNAGALRFYEREGFAPEAIMLRDTTYTP